MNFIPGVAKEDHSDYVLYFVENLSDELKQKFAIDWLPFAMEQIRLNHRSKFTPIRKR